LNSKGNTISKNVVSDSARGIYLNISENNKLSGNNVTNNKEYGIASQNSNGTLLSGNLVFDNARGIYFGRSDGNTLTGNTVRNNNVYGLYICGASDRNTIYDNYFNDTNMTIKNGTGNAYNSTKTAGTNIVGGPYIGGNYWAKPDGTGFSQTAVDKDEDGISDSAYTRISGSKYSDFLPLVIISKSPEPKTPVANFWGSPRSGDVPLNVIFTDISTETPSEWKWTFGDGAYSTEQNPVHTYSEAGNYTVTLTASNTAGSDTRVKNNYITALQKPITDFWGSPKSGSAPLNVTFTDNTTGTPTAWNWSFGDGIYSAVKSPKHTYSTAGNYTVTLTASNTAGSNTKIKTNYINVEKALEKPVANFWGSPRSGNVPLNVTFTDNTTGSPTAWNWSFGDGTYSTVESPKHTYPTAGNYTVKLTVSNKAGIGMMTKNSYIKAGKS
jgi:parallel beta-helix repeat protein